MGAEGLYCYLNIFLPYCRESQARILHDKFHPQPALLRNDSCKPKVTKCLLLPGSFTGGEISEWMFTDLQQFYPSMSVLGLGYMAGEFGQGREGDTFKLLLRPELPEKDSCDPKVMKFHFWVHLLEVRSANGCSVISSQSTRYARPVSWREGGIFMLHSLASTAGEGQVHSLEWKSANGCSLISNHSICHAYPGLGIHVGELNWGTEDGIF